MKTDIAPATICRCSTIPEIEITPEMIRAGAKAWLSYDSRIEDIDDVVARIWSAMSKAVQFQADDKSQDH